MSLPPLIVLCVSLRDCPNTLKPRLIVHYVSSTVDHSVCLKRLSEYSKCEIICSPHLFHQWIILCVSPSPRDCTNSMIWPKATVILKLIKNNSRCLFKRQQECDKIGNCHHKLAQQIEPFKISSTLCYTVLLIDNQASVWLSIGLCLCLSLCISVFLFLCLSLLKCLYLSLSLSIHLCLLVCLYLSVCWSVSCSVSTSLSVCLCLSLSHFLAVTQCLCL